MKRLFLMFVALLTVIGSFADGKFVMVNGLKYFVDTESKWAMLFANSYSGDITVPEKFTDQGVEYTVTAFADKCFKDCSALTSVSIPKTVTSLGKECFSGCSGLTSITIPDSVTSLDYGCFSECTSLASITIGSSVTSLGNYCFQCCQALTSITIPSSVTSLGNECFDYCTSLTSITIPESVTSLGGGCFSRCTNLTSISFPSSVTSLPGSCLDRCTSLTSITIPSSVTSLGEGCFWNCTGLTSITISSSVTTIGQACFYGCSSLLNIICKNPTPPNLEGNVFHDNTYLYGTLFVPDVDAYEKVNWWNKFNNIYKIPSGGDDKPSEACAKPIIGYADGQLKFTDATEGAKYHYTVTCSDVTTNKLNEDGSVDLTACYDISVYATAAGYKSSDKATAKLYWVKADGNLTTDNINSAKMRGIVVSSEGGIVTVSGLSDGEKVEFYAVDGKLVGAQKAVNGTASIATPEPVVICKMGSTSIKVLVK